MAFATGEFLAYLTLVVALYAMFPKSWRGTLLLVASYAFYWFSSGWLALLLLGTTLIAFYAAKKRSAIMLAVCFLILALALFKSLLLFGVSAFIPLGVSYYTFKLTGYLLDTYWGALEPEQRWAPFLTYTSFFPQIVGGPIQRAQSFLPQIASAETVSAEVITRGALRIMLGFFKKYVVADNLGEIVNYVYRHLSAHPGAPVALGFYGYPLQMYADFSGLTDIAIGAGVMLGITGPENFSAPFSAPNPSEYWRRWHISLTQWMADYVFTPLRMSLRTLGTLGMVLSIFINMVLIGLWHGFYLTFALFGFVHAIYLTVDALTQRWRKGLYKRHPIVDRMTDWVGPIVTFHLIAIAFVFFRADSIITVGHVFMHLFSGWESLSPQFREILQLQPGGSIYVLLLLIVVSEIADGIRRRYWTRPAATSVPRWAAWSAYGCTALAMLWVFCLVTTKNTLSSPFLYAIF